MYNSYQKISKSWNSRIKYVTIMRFNQKNTFKEIKWRVINAIWTAWHSFTGRNIKMTNEFYRSNYGQLGNLREFRSLR